MSTQFYVQLLIMEMIRSMGMVDPGTIRRRFPNTDKRDLSRDLELLLGAGMIVRASPLSSATLMQLAASQGGMHVTDAGIRLLVDSN